MSENHLAKREYFKLIRYLNSANKFKDESSHLFFELVVGKNHLNCMACLSSGPKVVVACFIEVSRIWIPGGLTPFDEIEKFICRYLNETTNPREDSTQAIRSILFQKIE